MSRRMSRNKWIIGSIIAALGLAIILILYFKLAHQPVNLNCSSFGICWVGVQLGAFYFLYKFMCEALGLSRILCLQTPSAWPYLSCNRLNLNVLFSSLFNSVPRTLDLVWEIVLVFDTAGFFLFVKYVFGALWNFLWYQGCTIFSHSTIYASFPYDHGSPRDIIQTLKPWKSNQ